MNSIGIIFLLFLLILIIIEVFIMSKEYETIDTVKQRDLLETTRNIGRLLTEEEFNEIMTVYKKVIDRYWIEEDK